MTEWLPFVGSLKLYVSFAKEPYKRDDSLQKRPTILCITTPCITTLVMMYPWCIPHIPLMASRLPLTNSLVTRWSMDDVSQPPHQSWCIAVTLLQKSPIKETIFCKRDPQFYVSPHHVSPHQSWCIALTAACLGTMSVSHVWMSNVTAAEFAAQSCDHWLSHMNESRHIYEWAMSHICGVPGYNVSHVWMSNVTAAEFAAQSCDHWLSRMNESRHMYEWAMSHICGVPWCNVCVTRMND